MKSINQRTHAWCEQHHVPSRFKSESPSTNSWAKTEFKNSSPLAVFLVDHQSEGRGRGTRTWTNAAPGATLLSTWCLSLEGTPQPIFSIRTGLMLWETLNGVWPDVKWALKAPNDIYVANGKFAGILIEIEQQHTIINAFIGVGANILALPTGIDQETFSLAGEQNVDEASWSSFCNLFVKGLLHLRNDAHRSLLTSSEMERLLVGLNSYPQNQVREILPDGGLILKNNGRLHWNEL